MQCRDLYGPRSKSGNCVARRIWPLSLTDLIDAFGGRLAFVLSCRFYTIIYDIIIWQAIFYVLLPEDAAMMATTR
jgi:hypothetical protein